MPKSKDFSVCIKKQMRKEVEPMELIMEHYGKAILIAIVLLALGAIIVLALKSDGYVAAQFKSALEGFFTNMNALR